MTPNQQLERTVQSQRQSETNLTSPEMTDEGNRRFRVLVNGQNCWLNIEGKPQKKGFYTTRFVEAQDAEKARAIAEEMIRRDSKLSNGLLNERDDPPVICAELVEEVGMLEPAYGYAFYPEDEDVH
jgi:hypothetical protein